MFLILIIKLLIINLKLLILILIMFLIFFFLANGRKISQPPLSTIKGGATGDDASEAEPVQRVRARGIL